MARRLVIAFDCDDVLIPTAEPTVKNYNDRFGTNLKLQHFYGHDDLTPWGGVAYDEAIGRVFDFLRSEEYAPIAPYVDAIEAIRSLAKDTEVKRTKSEVCRVLGADILVDDHIAHAEDVLSAGLKAIVFGNYPWNQRAILPKGMVRRKDWEGVKEEVAQHAA